MEERKIDMDLDDQPPSYITVTQPQTIGSTKTAMEAHEVYFMSGETENPGYNSKSTTALLSDPSKERNRKPTSDAKKYTIVIGVLLVFAILVACGVELPRLDSRHLYPRLKRRSIVT